LNELTLVHVSAEVTCMLAQFFSARRSGGSSENSGAV